MGDMLQVLSDRIGAAAGRGGKWRPRHPLAGSLKSKPQQIFDFVVL